MSFSHYKDKLQSLFYSNFSLVATKSSDAHISENTFFPACHYIASLFRDEIIKHCKAFPILYFKRQAATGKSTIARNITSLFGFQQEEINLKNKRNTETALVKILSQSSNSVVWFDEFENNSPYEDLLQAAYDTAGYHKSFDSTSNETEEVSIQSSLILTSNFLRKNEIFFTRCVYTPINNQKRTDKQEKAFETLTNLEINGLGCITLELLQYRKLILKQFLDTYAKIKSELKDRLKNEGVIDRAIQNVASLLACAYILQTNRKISICECVNEEDIMDEFCTIGYNQIIRQHHVSNERGDLSKFFEKLQLAYDQNKIHEGIHFRFRDEGSTRALGLKFSLLYRIYVESHKGEYWEAPVDKESIQTQLAVFLGKSEWSEIKKDICFKGSIEEEILGPADKNCCWLPYEELIKNFSINFKTRKSGF